MDIQNVLNLRTVFFWTKKIVKLPENTSPLLIFLLFQKAMSDADRQSIDEHVKKFKGKIFCNVFTVVVLVLPENRISLFIWSLSLQKRKHFWLGDSGVLNLSDKLENSYCILYFDKFFKSPFSVNKPFNKGMCCVGTVLIDWKNRKIMAIDKYMKIVEIDVHR